MTDNNITDKNITKNHNPYLYSVTLTGKILSNFEHNQVIQKVANLFKIDSTKTTQWFNAEPTIIKRDINHKQAFYYQTQLEKCGAEVLLTKKLIPQEETVFTMVPDGEEMTSYLELNARLNNGEQVECNYCHAKQSLSAYCIKCGKALLATPVKPIEPEDNAGHPKLIKVVIIITLVAAFYWGMSSYLF